MKWQVRVNTEYKDIETYTILDLNPRTGKCGVCLSGDPFDICTVDNEANAHLIAAAPEMYEALLSALGVMSTLDQSKNWVKEISWVIRSALIKAQGGTNEAKLP